MAKDFGSLKLYADKIAKFQQGKIIRAYADELGKDDVFVQALGEGVCAALATQWLHSRGVFEKKSAEELVRRAAGAQKKYMDSHDRDVLFKNASIKFDASVYMTFPGDPDLGTHMESWLRNDERTGTKAAYVNCKIREKEGDRGGGHALAVKQKSDGLHLFDANVGWYRIRSGVVQQFCDALEAGYARKGYTFSSPKFVPVKHV